MSNADNTLSNPPPATNVGSTLTANPGPTRLSNAGRKRRSCVTCSKRKVKCDKQKPCHSCTKIGSECVFPHISNRSQLALTPELMEMLQRLERVVQTLEPREQERPVETLRRQSNPQYDGHQQSASSFALDIAAAMPGAEHSQENMDVGPFDQSFGVEPSEPNIEVESDTQGPWPSIKIPSASSSYKDSPGRIVRDHGRDTYVKRWFWDECSTEVSKYGISRPQPNISGIDQQRVYNGRRRLSGHPRRPGAHAENFNDTLSWHWCSRVRISHP